MVVEMAPFRRRFGTMRSGLQSACHRRGGREVGAEEAAVQEWEQGYLLQDDKESANALRKAFEHGGFKAVMDWRLEHETEGTRGRYFSPFWLALKTAEARRPSISFE